MKNEIFTVAQLLANFIMLGIIVYFFRYNMKLQRIVKMLHQTIVRQANDLDELEHLSKLIYGADSKKRTQSERLKEIMRKIKFMLENQKTREEFSKLYSENEKKAEKNRNFFESMGRKEDDI